MNAQFDPTYGYTLEQLLKVPAPEAPADFAEFWRATYEEARAIPLRAERRLSPIASERFDVFEVYYDSLGGVRVGGWLTVPKDGRIERGVVAGHGYGPRPGPGLEQGGPPAAMFFFNARGFALSEHPAIPNESLRHVVHGIQSRETYVLRGCVADIWLAASALIECVPEAGRNLQYTGGSFSGGLGALALPWDARFRKAFLEVPTFGNHPLRVRLPSGGSGAGIRNYFQQHPEVLDVLAYYDAAAAARFVRIPVLAACALADPAVPPPGQFSVYNALAGPKKLILRKEAHPTKPDEDKVVYRQVDEWFAAD